MAAGILLIGCVTSKSGLVLDPVGPSIAQPPAAHPNTGTLTVYSAFDVNADFNSRDPDREEYSNYRINLPDGKLLRRVQNDNGSNFGSPAEVSLAPGNYRVVARANGFGTVNIPVTVSRDHVTTVHLEGGHSSGPAYNANQNDPVRLPDGNIVGWRTE